MEQNIKKISPSPRSGEGQGVRLEHWDMIIQPKAHLFDLKLKEVWNYRDLLFLFVKRDFVASYKQTILGTIWHFVA